MSNAHFFEMLTTYKSAHSFSLNRLPGNLFRERERERERERGVIIHLKINLIIIFNE